MKKLFVILIAFTLVLAACKQSRDDSNEPDSTLTLTIINSSSYDLTDVKFSGIRFSSSGSDDIPHNDQAVREIANEVSKLSYITFIRKPDGIACQVAQAHNVEEEPIFRFSDNTVVNEVGNSGNRGTLSQIKYQPQAAVHLGEKNIPKGDLVEMGETVNNTLKQLEFTIENTGKGELELSGNAPVSIGGSQDVFSVLQPASSKIAPNGSVTFKINFIPQTAQIYTGAVTISSDDPAGNYSFFVTAVGTPPKPIISVSYENVEVSQNGTINAGEVLITQSKNINVVIKNTGTLPLFIDTANIIISGADAEAFTKAGNPGANISAGGESQFSIIYAPVKEGVNQAALTIPSNDESRNPVVVYLTVTGVKGYAVLELSQGNTNISNGSSTAFDFGRVELGDSKALVFTVKNTGNISLELSGEQPIESSNSAFVVSTPSLKKTIAPNDSTSFSVRYTPTAEGVVNTGNITIANNSDNSLFTFYVQGTGYVKRPQIKVFYGNTEIPQYGTINLGTVYINEPQNITVNIRNDGEEVLTIDTANIAISGVDADVFVKTTNPAANISVGGQSSFLIGCEPVTIGENHATLTIPTNDISRSPFVVYLQATAVPVTQLTIKNESSFEITDVKWQQYSFANNQFQNSILPGTSVTNTVQSGQEYISFKRGGNSISAHTGQMILVEQYATVEFTFTDDMIIVENHNPNNNTGTLGALQATVVWWDDAEVDMLPYYYDKRPDVARYKILNYAYSARNNGYAICIGYNSNAMLHLKINLTRKAKLSFWYANRHSGTSIYIGSFSINGVEQRRWNTNVNWSYIEFDLMPGENDLIWSKRDSGTYYLSLDDILIYYTE